MPTPDLIPYLALLPYAAIALSLLVTLALFLSMKAEAQRTARRERKRVDDMLARLEQAAAPPSAPAAPEPVFVPVSVPPGFNLNRRVHVSRLLRKGDDPAHVAAVLNVPKAEVELLARVQEMAATAGPASR